MQPELQRNPYADHLAELNKTNPVLAAEDIYNERGAIIVPKGTQIDEGVSNKIARFSLRTPLELSVNLKHLITPKQFYTDIQKAPITLLDDLDDLYVAYKKELMRQCGNYSLFPLLSQKLTVMRDRLPQVYQYTQSITGIALSIAMNLGLDDETMDVIFIAAQMHESGLLNMPSESFKQINEMDDHAKNKFLQQQLEYGDQFLRSVPNLSERVNRAILEHKERRDGSGWPAGLVNNSQSIESQVVGVAAMLNEAYIHHLLPKGYGPQMLYTVLQMEGAGVDLGIYNGAAQLLMHNSHTTRRFLPDEFIPPLIRYIQVLQKSLVHWLGLAKQCAKDITLVEETHEAIRSEKIVAGLESTFRNSGLWEQGLISWLNDVANSENTTEYREVEIIAIMFDLALEKLKRLLWSLFDASKKIGNQYLKRCTELHELLRNIPDNHYLALENYDYL
tara:strand:+ start:2770 stop:4113 length:1344 start_codon:yes stop_codon:yes gene_type:complete